MAISKTYTFNDVLTPQEKAMLSQRVAIAELSAEGATYAKIKDLLGCSQASIDNTRRLIGLKK